MPTGVNNSPAVKDQLKPAFIQQNAVNENYYIIVGTTGRPAQGPPIEVQPGTSVTLRAHNGQDAGNAKLVRVARRVSMLGAKLGTPITPDSEISWPCNNLREVCVVGTAGDGVCINVQAGRR